MSFGPPTLFSQMDFAPSSSGSTSPGSGTMVSTRVVTIVLDANFSINSPTTSLNASVTAFFDTGTSSSVEMRLFNSSMSGWEKSLRDEFDQ